MNTQAIIKVFLSLGMVVSFETMPDISLPAAFYARYDMELLTIKDTGLKYLLIKDKRRGSLASYIKQAKLISQKTAVPFLLVFKEIDKSTKALLLKEKIPFIDLKGNLFIPDLGQLMAAEASPLVEKKFTVSEQLALIKILLGRNSGYKVETVAKSLGVSQVTIYRAFNKFAESGWLNNKQGEYSLRKNKRNILKEAENFLFNPIKQTVYIDPHTFRQLFSDTQKVKVAGLRALSEHTNLAEESDCYAVASKDFKTVLTENPEAERMIYQDSLGEEYEVQLWRYAPSLVSTTSSVDPISLYLTTKNVDDPRVEKELDYLLDSLLTPTPDREAANSKTDNSNNEDKLANIHQWILNDPEFKYEVLELLYKEEEEGHAD